MDVILQMGFPGYFLVVADFINWAKDNGIRVGPGRGSGAGSMCAYAMRITDLDPLEHGLLFERFLNPERLSMPDFDIDFDERRRGEVIRYVTEKYGEDRVSMIVTYGTIKAKQAVKDASRILGYPFAMGDRITKAMPAAVMGKDIPLKQIFDPAHKRHGEGGEFRSLYESDQDVKTVVDTAIGLEGLKRQWGVHAAGVIMSSEPLLDIIPLIRRPQDGAIITQFDYPMCEHLGLIKMDFLGLRNLTVLDDTVKNIERNRGETIVLEDLALDDPATYALMQRGDTLGVFQLDGGPMRALLRSMRPDQFADICAVGALYRPGPMGMDSHNKYARRKTGREPLEPIHPELAEPLDEILGETYGLTVYQEHVLAIVQKVAGYSLGQADLLRKAMGKKKREILDAEFVPFEAGMLANGYSKGAIKTLWDVLVPFSDYAFNKAHAAAYGLVSYWTAYLKANYPAEYMAALLTSVKDDKDKMAIYLNECRRMKIQVLPPDVNESDATFTPVGTDIRFGLTAIRNVGANVVDKVVEARETKGRYEHFNDFLDKVDPLACNKRVMDSLIKAGAFDDMKHKRRALVAIHEQAVDRYSSIKKDSGGGQDSLFDDLMSGDAPPIFDMTVAVPDIDEWDKMTLLGHEREMLGLYVSDHPLTGLEHLLQSTSDCSIGQLLLDEERPENSPITITGLITSVQRKITRKGDTWAVVTIEDLDGGDRRAAVPGHLPAGRRAARRGRDRDREGQDLAQQGPARDPGRGGHGPGPRGRSGGARRGEPAGHPVHAPGGRPAQGGAPHPSRRDRGPPAAARSRAHQGFARRRQFPGGRWSTSVRRPQAPARSGLPERMNENVDHASRGLFASGSPALSILRTVLLTLLAYAVMGVVAGIVWEAVWTPPGQVIAKHQVFFDSYASLRGVFTGTGWYVLVGGLASALVSLVVCLLTRRRGLLTLALVIVGSAVGAAVMLKVGTHLGPADPASIAAHTVKRTTVAGQLTVEGKTVLGVKSPYLVWPMTSLMVLSLVFFAVPVSPVELERLRPHPADPREADVPGARHG